MTMTTLDSGDPDFHQLAADDQRWIVACLCAGWCNVCTAYRPAFTALAERHPDKQFLWIDVEDEAAVVGDFDVDNFPTLLMQRGDTVAFYGTLPPDAQVAERILNSVASQTDAALATEARSSAERRGWQEDANLRRAISQAHGERHADR
jgi:thioredoxin-like negative regulator of GroEL